MKSNLKSNLNHPQEGTAMQRRENSRDVMMQISEAVKASSLFQELGSIGRDPQDKATRG